MFGIAIKLGPESYRITRWLDYNDHYCERNITRGSPVFPFLTKEDALAAYQKFRNTYYPDDKTLYSARLYEFQSESNHFEDIDV